MKTYKATYDGTCRDITYEIGKEYYFDGELIPCVQGFHSCLNLQDVFKYYDLNKDIKIYECEVEDDYIVDCDKICSNNLKIIKEVDLSNFITYNDVGNIIYTQNGCGYQEWFYYDHNENCISYKRGYKDNMDVFYSAYYYDNNNLIYQMNSYGTKIAHKYNTKNKRILSKYDEGREKRYKYNNNDKLIYIDDSDRDDVSFKYDENNNCIFRKEGMYIKKWEYDKNNKLIYYYDSFHRLTCRFNDDLINVEHRYAKYNILIKKFLDNVFKDYIS